MIRSAGCDQIRIVFHGARLLPLPIQPFVNTAFNLTGILLLCGLKIQHQVSAFPLSANVSHHRSHAAPSPFLLVIPRGTFSVSQLLPSKSAPVHVHEK